MSAAVSSVGLCGLNSSKAATPWGMEVEGTTCMFFSEMAAAWRAACTMLPLFGRKMTLSDGAASTASRIWPTLGFMVSPPASMPAAPMLLNTASMPSPRATATMAAGASDTAGASCSRLSA